jgi:hypothetical protein
VEETKEVITALGGVVLGFVLAFIGTLWRDKKQTAGEKKLLAGALAAELEGSLALLEEAPPRRSSASDKPASGEGEPWPEKTIVSWPVEQSYFSVYDSAGAHLYLLRPLVGELVVCYFNLKRALDNLRALQRTSENLRTMDFTEARRLQPVFGDARGAAEASREQAMQKAKQLLPKLRKLAGCGG